MFGLWAASWTTPADAWWAEELRAAFRKLDHQPGYHFVARLTLGPEDNVLFSAQVEGDAAAGDRVRAVGCLTLFGVASQREVVRIGQQAWERPVHGLWSRELSPFGQEMDLTTQARRLLQDTVAAREVGEGVADLRPCWVYELNSPTGQPVEVHGLKFEVSGQVYVAKRDGLPRRVALRMTTATTTGGLTIEFSRVGTPATIEPPQEDVGRVLAIEDPVLKQCLSSLEALPAYQVRIWTERGSSTTSSMLSEPGAPRATPWRAEATVFPRERAASAQVCLQTGEFCVIQHGGECYWNDGREWSREPQGVRHAPSPQDYVGLAMYAVAPDGLSGASYQEVDGRRVYSIHVPSHSVGFFPPRPPHLPSRGRHEASLEMDTQTGILRRIVVATSWVDADGDIVEEREILEVTPLEQARFDTGLFRSVAEQVAARIELEAKAREVAARVARQVVWTLDDPVAMQRRVEFHARSCGGGVAVVAWHGQIRSGAGFSDHRALSPPDHGPISGNATTRDEGWLRGGHVYRALVPIQRDSRPIAWAAVELPLRQ